VRFQFRGHIHPVPLRPSLFLSCKHFSCHIYPSPQRATPFSGLCGPRLLTRSPRWHYCRISRTDLWPPLTSLHSGQQQLYMVCIARSLSVFVSCLLDVLPCASRLSHSYIYDVCALLSLGLLLRNGDSFTTRNLRDCSLSRFFNFVRPFLSLLSKDMFLIRPKKSKSLPYPWRPFPHPVFSPLCRPYPSHGFTIRPFVRSAVIPLSPSIADTYAFFSYPFVDLGLRAPLSQNG
jgi:hypothetical protein